jgi:ubiquinone biosynthesis protein
MSQPVVLPSPTHFPVKGRPPQKIRVLLRGLQLGFIAAICLTRCAGRVLLEHLPFIKRNADVVGCILAATLERMGPTFIKLGQMLSSRPDLVSSRIARPLSRLRDHVTPLPTPTITKIIETSFGTSLDKVFRCFQAEPIATGSIAQVHLAILNDGQTLAVKVQRPSLKTLMERDFAVVRFVGRLLEQVPGFRNVPFCDLFRELEDAIQSQLDFEREAKNNERFQENLAQRNNVKIPRLAPKLCNRSVITMEYMSGLIPVEALQLSYEDRRVAAKSGLETLYQMIFVDGLVHADLHPGNVFFLPNGEMVILDFGLVASLSDEVRIQFSEFFFAMATNNGRLCANIVQQTAQSLAPGFDSVAFTGAMSEMVDRFAGRRVEDFEVARFATELFDLQRRFGIRGSTAFTLTIISLLLFEGILKTLDPEMDFQREASTFMLALRIKALDYERTAVIAALKASRQDHPTSQMRH